MKRVAVLLEVENAVWLRAVALEALAALFALPHFVLLLFQRLPNKCASKISSIRLSYTQFYYSWRGKRV